jgi:hypothetical protein
MRELTQEERKTLFEMYESFLDHTGWGDEDLEMAYSVMSSLRDNRIWIGEPSVDGAVKELVFKTISQADMKKAVMKALKEGLDG